MNNKRVLENDSLRTLYYATKYQIGLRRGQVKDVTIPIHSTYLVYLGKVNNLDNGKTDG